MTNTNHRSKASGQGLVIIIILLAVIGAGAWWLVNNKQTMDRDARVFGKEAVQRLAVTHDQPFLAERLGPQGKLDYPPSRQAELMAKFRELGTPAQPIQIEEAVFWQSHFFEPKGQFIAHLNYPGNQAVLELGISHPVGRWQLDEVKLSYSKPR
jgi:hypothetical protein